MTSPAPARLDRQGYALAVEDAFEADELKSSLWIPYYLPQWSSRAASAARYTVGGGQLRLRIDADQEPWCPEFDGDVRVSSLQTGVQSGPLGSPVGQHRFREGLVVREVQERRMLYTPRYGLFELLAAASDDPTVLVALWMIGLEDRPDESAEICITEIFGRDVRPSEARVGMGLHPFGDPRIRDDFAAVPLAIDARQPHWYAAEWTPERVAFYVDEQLVKVVRQSPGYPMQLMLNIYEFRDPEARSSSPGSYPKEFVVSRFRGWQTAGSQGDSAAGR